MKRLLLLVASIVLICFVVLAQKKPDPMAALASSAVFFNGITNLASGAISQTVNLNGHLFTDTNYAVSLCLDGTNYATTLSVSNLTTTTFNILTSSSPSSGARVRWSAMRSP